MQLSLKFTRAPWTKWRVQFTSFTNYSGALKWVALLGGALFLSSQLTLRLKNWTLRIVNKCSIREMYWMGGSEVRRRRVHCPRGPRTPPRGATNATDCIPPRFLTRASAAALRCKYMPHPPHASALHPRTHPPSLPRRNEYKGTPKHPMFCIRNHVIR